jgi:hypothetical protein
MKISDNILLSKIFIQNDFLGFFVPFAILRFRLLVCLE